MRKESLAKLWLKIPYGHYILSYSVNQTGGSNFENGHLGPSIQSPGYSLTPSTAGKASVVSVMWDWLRTVNEWYVYRIHPSSSSVQYTSPNQHPARYHKEETKMTRRQHPTSANHPPRRPQASSSSSSPTSHVRTNSRGEGDIELPPYNNTSPQLPSYPPPAYNSPTALFPACRLEKRDANAEPAALEEGRAARPLLAPGIVAPQPVPATPIGTAAVRRPISSWGRLLAILVPLLVLGGVVFLIEYVLTGRWDKEGGTASEG